MGIYDEYIALQIKYLENENMLLLSLVKNFKGVVFTEFKRIGCFKTAFENISKLHLEVSKVPYHLTYDQFLKTL